MSHWCCICGSARPNESFTGKGHRTHICRECQAIPTEERDAIQHEEEIFAYLKQSHISAKNVARLREFLLFNNQRIAMLAELALDVALIKPHKRKRLRYLAEKRPDLIDKLEETGLIHAHDY